MSEVGLRVVAGEGDGGGAAGGDVGGKARAGEDEGDGVGRDLEEDLALALERAGLEALGGEDDRRIGELGGDRCLRATLRVACAGTARTMRSATIAAA